MTTATAGSGPDEPMHSNVELIGRERLDDLESVLSVVGHQEADGRHLVADPCPAEFTWDYQKGRRERLDRLYEKAKKAQWNATTDLPWETEVDQEKVVAMNAEANQDMQHWTNTDLSGTALEGWGEKEWLQLGVENQNWMLSQFLHGEQGALLCTAKIVETVPWIDAKYYAATQVVDEARHVEVFSRYLDEKLSGHYPLNGHLGLLLDDILGDSRWDMTYLGMQIMVEGLALAAFGFIHAMTTEPLLKQLLRYVMADEARHVAFGVISLQELYSQLTRGRAARTPGVRLRGRRAHEGPHGHAGGVGAVRRAHQGRHHDPPPGSRARRLPDPVVLQDRAQPQEAGPARRGRRLAADQVHRDGGDRLRGPPRLDRGGRRLRRRVAGGPPGGLTPGAARGAAGSLGRWPGAPSPPDSAPW